MYGVILMAALSTAPTTQGHCFRNHGCHGYHGCHSRYSGYYGCYGCHGYYGYGHNYATYYGCHGCYGCYGSWAGHYGGYYGGHIVCHGCYGAYGGHSCYGTPAYSTTYVEPAPPSRSGDAYREPARRSDSAPKGEVTPLPREQQKNDEQARARITIDVPADAKLYIDGQLMKSGSTRRVFQTPQLRNGQLYFYDVRVEVVRNGQTLTQNERVILRPGQESTASFASLGQSTPDATARTE